VIGAMLVFGICTCGDAGCVYVGDPACADGENCVMATKQYIVSCNHVVEKYRLNKELITVEYKDYRPHGGGEEYYWFRSPYGCSKSYRTATNAIYGMLGEHGCTDIHITEAETQA
jgi:hypothetical protein